MQKFIKNLHTKQKLKLIVILLMIIVIVWAFTSNTADTYSFDVLYNSLDEGFTQIIDGEEIYLQSIQDYIDVEEGETLTLLYEVPDINYDKVLFFYSKDLEINIYADDVLIYSFEMQEGFEFLKTPGNCWNSIDIPTKLVGQTLRIELSSNFSNRFQSAVTNLYLINESETLSVILGEMGFRILMSIILVIMAAFVYFNCAIWKNERIKICFIRLANFYLCVSMWLFSMYNAFDYFIHKPILSYIISMLMAVFIPVVLYEFVKVVFAKYSKATNFAGYVLWGNFALQLILQFVFKISLLDLLPLTYVIYGLGATFVIGLIVHHIATEKKKDFEIVSLLIVFTGAILEIIVLCFAPQRIDLIGVSSVLGLLGYLIVNHFYILKRESKIESEKLELEKSYNRLQNTTLTQQIKGHFFFNTLNSISALCKYDSKEADRAINIFAKYMRSYMHLINTHENIPFESEMELIETILEIDKIRFYRYLNYEIDLECTDFKIPPLSVQVAIENAMIHGFGKSKKDAKLSIKTRKYDEYVEVIISDNGAGFDTSILANNKSIGLKNLENRLKIMANGHLKIKSEIGKGTQVTIVLPC
ncbi:MAG: histidine kinase [Clostridia bacterium]